MDYHAMPEGHGGCDNLFNTLLETTLFQGVVSNPSMVPVIKWLSYGCLLLCVYELVIEEIRNNASAIFHNFLINRIRAVVVKILQSSNIRGGGWVAK
jgi:hypothetical protein